jgi:uncharacterized protein (DUF885 family)
MRYLNFRKITIVALFLALGISSCKQKDTNEQSRFDAWTASFVEDLWKQSPDMALGAGYHKYDSLLVVPDKAYNESMLKFCSAKLAELTGFDPTHLSTGGRTDRAILENMLKRQEWQISDFRQMEWDPSMYNIGESFSLILAYNRQSLNLRLQHIFMRMKQVPAYYEAAKANLRKVTVEHMAMGIEQNLGSLEVFDAMIRDSLKASSLSAADKKEYTTEIDQALAAVNGYVKWLRNKQKPEEKEIFKNFRIGKEQYDKKFAYYMESAYTAEEMYDKAVKRKTEVQTEMAKLGKQLWPKYFPGEKMGTNDLETVRKVIDKISLHHTTADSFQTAIEQGLPALIDFVNSKKLLYVDPSKPLVVRKEPAYMAGVAGASVDSPGPYDKEGNSYYNVGSLSGWPADHKESYLREYNDYILQILNMHEAIPGHYTQLVYSNNSPSIVKRLFGSNSMIEGWAVYVERMMMEEGYDNNEPEMWLMYYKWHLRSVCNTILDCSVHVKGMSKEQAIDLLVNQAFQEKAEAEEKWHRVSVTQVQLCCYFTGFSEIYDLREAMKKKQGDKFDLKTFHEKFLSYGSAPVKYIRELMMEDTPKP